MQRFSKKKIDTLLPSFHSPVHSGRAKVERSTSRREIVGDEARRRRSEMRKKMLEEMDRKDDKVKVRLRDQGSEGHAGDTEEHAPGDDAAANAATSPPPPPYTSEGFPLQDADEAEQSKSVTKKSRKSKGDEHHHSDSMLDDGVQREHPSDVYPDRLAVEKGEEETEAHPPPPPTSPPPMTDEELGIPGRIDSLVIQSLQDGAA